MSCYVQLEKIRVCIYIYIHIYVQNTTSTIHRWPYKSKRGGRGARGHNMHLNMNTIIMAHKIILLFTILYVQNPQWGVRSRVERAAQTILRQSTKLCARLHVPKKIAESGATVAIVAERIGVKGFDSRWGQFLLAKEDMTKGNKTMDQEFGSGDRNWGGLSVLPRPGHAWTTWKAPPPPPVLLSRQRLLRRCQHPSPASAQCQALHLTQPPHVHHA
jgi:hypothetical protein